MDKLYFLGDALGSTRQLSDPAGNITLAQNYDPFGNNIASMGDEGSILGYAGQQTDTTGLQYLRARYYDPGTGRFLTHDSFPGYLNLSQSQNPYVYGLDNPVLYRDPSGKCVFTPFDFAFCMGALIGGSVDLFTQLHHNGGDLNCINWGEVAISAGTGGVAGLVGLVSFEVLLPAAGATLADYIIAGTLSGALTGQYARLTTYALSGQYERIGNIGTDMFNPKDMFIDAVLGGVFSAAGYGLEQILGNLASFSARNVSEDGNAIEDASSGQSSENGLDDTYCPTSFTNSFTADTPVDTSKGETPISDVKAGDYVLAYNEESNTTGWYPVTDTIKHEDKTIVHLVLDNEKITTTPEHPFYTKEKGWVNAIDLKTDMHVRKADGSYGAVKSVTTKTSAREMYNLTVGAAHTYFVGDGQWLVHNCESLPNTANKALQQLPGRLKATTIAVSLDENGNPILAVYNRTEGGTEDVVQYLRNRGWNVLDAPEGRGPVYHAERQLYDEGYTNIGISRQGGMCEDCGIFFGNKPNVTIESYRRP